MIASRLSSGETVARQSTIVCTSSDDSCDLPMSGSTLMNPSDDEEIASICATSPSTTARAKKVMPASTSTPISTKSNKDTGGRMQANTSGRMRNNTHDIDAINTSHIDATNEPLSFVNQDDSQNMSRDDTDQIQEIVMLAEAIAREAERSKAQSTTTASPNKESADTTAPLTPQTLVSAPLGGRMQAKLVPCNKPAVIRSGVRATDEPATQEPVTSASIADKEKEHDATSPSLHPWVGERSGDGFGKAETNITQPHLPVKQNHKPDRPEDAVSEPNQRPEMDPILTMDQEIKDHPDQTRSDDAILTGSRHDQDRITGYEHNPSDVAAPERDPIVRDAGTPVSDDRDLDERAPEAKEERQQ